MENEIDLKVVRLCRFDNEDSKLKAFVDIAIGEFIIKGLRILKGKNGLFLGMPQEQGKDGKWYSLVYTDSPEAKAKLTEVVLAAYQSEA